VDNRKIKAAVVSVSDTRREEDDISGGILVDLLVSAGADVVEKLIVPDDLTGLRETLYTLTEREDVNLIVTTGGTGFAERDNTPEASLMVIEREAPGLAEAMRAATLKNTPFAMLSRGICGIRNSTLIINLPGSPKGVEECFEVVRPVLQHAINQISGNVKHED
jgi:molybdenum cofactor synthesis domain-containing protein